MKHLLSIVTLSLCTTTLVAQEPYHRPPGMPENALVAFDDFKSESNPATLHALLAIKSFRWMLQIPDSGRTVIVDLAEIDTESQKAREVARITFDAFPVDPAKRENRPMFFPITITMMPDDTRSEEPWRTSWSFVALLEVPDLNISIRRTYPNPFRGSNGGVSTFNTTRIATPLPTKAGMWDGFGTAFDIMARGNDDKHTMRVSFSTSPGIGE